MQYWFLLLLISIGAQLAVVGSDYWLSRWSQQSLNDQQELTNIWIYLAVSFGAFLLSNLRTQSFFLMMIKAGSNLHDLMFKGVICSPMFFFESNPVGRILNRFTKDTSVIDEFLPGCIWDVLSISLFMLAIISVLGVMNPIALVSLIFLIPAFVLSRRKFVRSSIEIKRLDVLTKSPLISAFSSSIDGIMTIRAFQCEDNIMESFMSKIDKNNRAWYSFLYSSRWIGHRLDVMASFMILVASNAAVFIDNKRNYALIAFSLVYTMRMTALLQWMVRQSAEVENQMTSLERIQEYIALPKEQSSETFSKEFKDGDILIKSFSMRYRRDLDLSLKDLNVEIKSGEKIGVCGRTGAGKSSLSVAFFRLAEADRGSIYIGGEDIAKMPLDMLRRNLCIIPQQSLIFTGSVRYNLDPFSIVDDHEIWEALEFVQLKSLVKELPGGLDCSTFTFSSGQSQLICIARALLKPSKILFIDEATANVDRNTDKVIQALIREKFKDRTVIIIAHRLNTIIDCDKILVMDAGRVAEFGTPAELLNISDGIFTSLASESGIQL